jgi:hypothetical protein
MFSGTAQFSHQVCQFFFVSSLCLLVRVTMVDKHKALPRASRIGHNVIRKEESKRKIWIKKRYLKMNISCYAHLLNELLETDVS